MAYLIEKMNECERHLKEASENQDINLVYFWTNAFLGFEKRAKAFLEKHGL